MTACGGAKQGLNLSARFMQSGRKAWQKSLYPVIDMPETAHGPLPALTKGESLRAGALSAGRKRRGGAGSSSLRCFSWRAR